MKFFKYEGAGNDFILIEGKELFDCTDFSYIGQLCDRHFGIGADGLIRLEESEIADVRMRIFNSDGFEATMCGNALRCIVLHMQKELLSIETAAGICYGKILDGKIFATFPYIKELRTISFSRGQEGVLVDSGVPHLLLFDQEEKDFEKEARALRLDERLGKEGANVSYIKRDREKIFIRTYERGVEKETLACGSAAAASVFLIRKNDKKKHFSYSVFPKSKKEMIFSFDEEDKMWMQGPTSLVFEGWRGVINDKEKNRHTERN